MFLKYGKPQPQLLFAKSTANYEHPFCGLKKQILILLIFKNLKDINLNLKHHLAGMFFNH